MLLALTAEAWTAVGTVGSTVVLLTTLIYLAAQVRIAKDTRREQFRPWVTVTFHFRSNIAFAAIRSTGATVARDVKVRFEPQLVTTLPDQSPVALLEQPIPILAPGDERLILLDRVPDRLKSDLPKSHTAHVAYRGERKDDVFAADYVLDFSVLDGLRLGDKGLHDLVEEVGKIRQTLESEARSSQS